MSAERTYKALDYSLKLYGFWPLDLCAILLVLALLHGVFDDLLLDLLVLGPLTYIAWRGRKREAGFLRSLLLFASTPSRFPVGLHEEHLQ